VPGKNPLLKWSAGLSSTAMAYGHGNIRALSNWATRAGSDSGGPRRWLQQPWCGRLRADHRRKLLADHGEGPGTGSFVAG